MAVSKSKTLLVLCGSLGLGNSARLLGIVQAIRHRFRVPKERLRIVVCAAGKPARFWTEHGPGVQAESKTLDEYLFSSRQSQSSRVRWAGFLRPRNAAVYLRNCLRLRALLQRHCVDLAL